MTTDERLMRLLGAKPEMLEAVDRVLEGRPAAKPNSGPLLLAIGPASRFLGVSRWTLRRMAVAGVIERIEVLPGSFRVRRGDLEAIANGKGASA